MATIRVNSFAGSDSNDGLSEGAPKQTLAAARSAASAGDDILVHRAYDVIMDAAFGFQTLATTSAAGPWSTLGAYGEARRAHAVIDNINASGPTINVNGGATARFRQRLQDLWIKGTGHTGIPIQVHANAGDLEYVEIKRCRVTGARGSAGLVIKSDNVNTLTTRNVLVEDCEFYDNGTHGTLVTGQTENIVFRRCKSARNGTAGGAHGFSSFGDRVDATGFSVVSGNVYSKGSLTYRDVYYVNLTAGSAAATYPKLTKNTATPTTPGAGEFGYVPATTPGTSTDGVLYINVGANPSGNTISVCYGRVRWLVYDRCEAWGNFAYLEYTYHEGAGFQLDDNTESSIIRACKSWDNDGPGYAVNWGSNNAIHGSEAFNNGWPGVIVTRAAGALIDNNTLRRNNRLATHGSFANPYNAEVALQLLSTAAKVRQNAIESTVGYGVSADATSTATTVDRNNIEARTGRLSGSGLGAESNGTAEVLADVLQGGNELAPAGYSVASPHPLANAGSYLSGVVLRNGRLRPGRCPAGAYQIVYPISAS